MAEVWKQKCKELIEICNKLKEENENMKEKLQLVSSSEDYGMAKRSSH